MWGKNGAISKKRMLFKAEKPSEEAFQDLLKSCLSFGGVWMVLMNKNGDTTEARAPIVPIVKCGETPSECVEEGELVKISWDSPCAMVQ